MKEELGGETVTTSIMTNATATSTDTNNLPSSSSSCSCSSSSPSMSINRHPLIPIPPSLLSSWLLSLFCCAFLLISSPFLLVHHHHQQQQPEESSTNNNQQQHLLKHPVIVSLPSPSSPFRSTRSSPPNNGKQRNRVAADIGDNVVLHCDLEYPEGIPVPYVVQWQKLDNKIPIYIWYDGYPPHTSEEYEGRASLVGRSSLNLTNVRDSDHGWYECKIFFLNRPPETPDNGTWILLDVQTPPQFKIKPPDVVYVKTGESLSLPCEALGTPSPAVIWYKEKVLLEESVNLQILPNELRISSLRQADMGDYVCSAKNREGVVTATTRVIVAGPAAITGPPRNLTKLEGDRTELPCITKALPSNVTHRWLMNGSDVTSLTWMSSRVSVKRDGTLVLNPVTAEDSGIFTCEVSNGIGNPDSASATLSVEYPARVTYSPTIQFLPLGLPGVVRCYFQSNPAFQFITWAKDRRPFEPGEYPGVNTLKNGSLFFQRVSQEHQGSYRCTPINIHGTTGPSSPMEVLVREAPLLSTVKPTGGIFVPPDQSWSVHGDFTRSGSTPSTTTLSFLDPDQTGDINGNNIDNINSANVGELKPGPARNITVQRVAMGYAISWLPPSDSSIPAAYYYIEYKEGDSSNQAYKMWGPIPGTGDTSYLARNLKPGSTYTIRIASYNAVGAGSVTHPYEFDIPGPASKTKDKDKAIAAGVVGGILFFVASIVLSVCAVKICNKRKRRKAEKAYMMVTCPITTSSSEEVSASPSSPSNIMIPGHGHGHSHAIPSPGSMHKSPLETRIPSIMKVASSSWTPMTGSAASSGTSFPGMNFAYVPGSLEQYIISPSRTLPLLPGDVDVFGGGGGFVSPSEGLVRDMASFLPPPSIPPLPAPRFNIIRPIPLHPSLRGHEFPPRGQPLRDSQRRRYDERIAEIRRERSSSSGGTSTSGSRLALLRQQQQQSPGPGMRPPLSSSSSLPPGS